MTKWSERSVQTFVRHLVPQGRIQRPTQRERNRLDAVGAGLVKLAESLRQAAAPCWEDDVRHKIAVLERHCAGVGRDCAEIMKTRLGALVIAPTEAEVQRKLADLARAHNLDEERLRTYVMAGTPAQVQEWRALPPSRAIPAMMKRASANYPV